MLQLGLRARVRVEVVGVGTTAALQVATADAVASPPAAASVTPAGVKAEGRNGRGHLVGAAGEKASCRGMKRQDPAVEEHSVGTAHLSGPCREKASSGQDLEFEILGGGSRDSRAEDNSNRVFPERL